MKSSWLEHVAMFMWTMGVLILILAVVGYSKTLGIISGSMFRVYLLICCIGSVIDPEHFNTDGMFP